MCKVGRCLEKIVEGAAAAGLTAAVLLVLFFSQADYNCKITFLLPNSLLMAVGLGLTLLYVAICHGFSGTSLAQRREDVAMWLDRAVPWICVGLFCVEVYISFCIFFYPGWDPGTIWTRAWQRIWGDPWGDYFSRYPNNLLLLLAETFLLRLNLFAGVFTGNYAPMACIIVDCATISMACGLVYRQMCLMSRRRYAMVAFALCVLLAGLSPWMCIFYSDTLGILFPILVLYLYTKPRKTDRGGKWSRATAILLGCVGYFLKPQCIISVVAIACMEVVYALKQRSRGRVLRVLTLAALGAASMLLLSNLLVWRYEAAGVPLEKEEAFGMAHYFMMGLNEETDGGFSEEDMTFSNSFATSAERTHADWARAFGRLKDMGISGYLRHLTHKMLMTFHDGTFSWWVEGTFYTPAVEPANNWTAPALQSLYYRDGEKHEYLKLAEQAAWMTVLLLSAAYTLCSLRKPGRFDTGVLKLTVFGTMLFLMLFESRARYLFMHIPLFCILAGLGVEELTEMMRSQKRKIGALEEKGRRAI